MRSHLPLRRRARRRLLALGALPLALMQCAPPGCADEAWKANYPAEPQFTLRHDFSLSPGLEAGKVTSCIARESQVHGRAHLCRIVEGHEAVDDFRNWYVDGQPWESDPIPDSVIIGQSGEASSSWGITIVTSAGEQFEGCNWYAPTGNYFCDYKVSRQTVLTTSRRDRLRAPQVLGLGEVRRRRRRLRLRCGQRLGRFAHHRELPPGVRRWSPVTVLRIGTWTCARCCSSAW